MKKILKVIGILLGIIVIGILGFLVYFNISYPKISPAKDLKVEATPQRIERGDYLANHVVQCLDCHSKRDFSKYTGPMVAGTEGMGGEVFDHSKANIPGVLYAKNITPAGISDWTDGELYRTITTGVTKDGTALFPLMPYMNYRKLADEDIYSIIAYIRTLKPIENKVAERSLNFPLNLIVKSIPSDVEGPPPTIPDKSNIIAYGAYMTNAAACIDCHTKLEKGQIMPGTEFAGGFVFCLDGRCVVSANITPDNETGIGTLSKEDFLNKFRFYRDPATHNIPVGKGGNNTAMPWTQLSGMTDDDLGAIYAYLRTIPPIHNKIEKFIDEKDKKD